MSGKVFVPLFLIIINMPAVTRVGDADVAHCSGMSRAQGSGNVFANGRPISRQGDKNTVHLKPCLLYTSPSPRDAHESRMPSSA